MKAQELVLDRNLRIAIKKCMGEDYFVLAM